MTVQIKGLTPSQAKAYQEHIKFRESGGNYAHPGNQSGFIGAYQMGTTALQEAGYVKMSAPKSNNALNDPNNWTIPGGKATFLSNPQIQDDAFQKYTNKNHYYLTNGGKVNSSTPPGEVAGLLAASHLVGGPTVAKSGIVGNVDGNGTKDSSYYTSAKMAVLGTPTKPGEEVTKAPSENQVPLVVPSSSETVGKEVYQPGPFESKGQPTYVVSLSPAEGHVYEQPENFPLPNPLEPYASYSPVFTFSCLSAYEVNYPDVTYKAGNISNIIFRSGGGFPDKRIETLYGKFEYYIENMEMSTIMGFNRRTHSSNATSISFTVVEPYSMGMFLQSLYLAANNSGYVNYVYSPFLLTIEFLGHFSNGTSGVIPNTIRHIPLKLMSVEMTVNESGCTYEVTAYPWNEVALTDSNNLFDADIAISGETIAEMLQTGERSLQYTVNSRLADIAERDTGSPIPDEIVILFPKFLNSDATPVEHEDKGKANVDPNAPNEQPVAIQLTLNRGDNQTLLQEPTEMNEIGLSKMGFTQQHGGQTDKAKESEVYHPSTSVVDRAKLQINPSSREFMFAQNTSITNAITQVILMSDFGRKITEDRKDEMGMYTWFRIETQTFVMEPNEANIKNNGRPPLLIVYKVVPYKVHPMRFARLNTTPPGYETIRKNVAKEYNYIYTGRNVDVLGFEIKLDTAFYAAVAGDDGQLHLDTSNQNENATGGNSTTGYTTSPGNTRDGSANPSVVKNRVNKFSTDNVGGTASEDHKTRIARQFHNALLDSPSDMISAELSILGDPYFIADSGMGNWSNTHTGTFNMTETGSINYQNGEVDIYINFRTPLDINTDSGFYDFGETQDVPQFSGLYQVLTVTNTFEKGLFKQQLDLIRRRDQEQTTSTGVNNTPTSDDYEDTGSACVVPKDFALAKTKSSLAKGDNNIISVQPVQPGKELSN